MLVRGEARRGGTVPLRCIRDEIKGCPALEIPEWMFDSHLGGPMKPAGLPRVDCATPLALKHLLSAATESRKRDVVVAQHGSISSGDADTQAVAVEDPSRRVVLSLPAKLTELPAEMRQKMAQLLARMLNEHLLHHCMVVRPEVGDE